ncbi:hypothetical protein [Flavobacterium sharifuzzamanii]|uniref:hypothetical protein n=1 Tax=Flavobacterium sharifuzzamanii TaxID=2211133 RepID=UPI000DAC1D9C|nr:hypothetical protein [Flavobacterium sharifuzzamanii]KAF2080317.1 hypothetical protein DMA14_13540 [Flavobacterium sharifuzzamanii]
MKNLLILIFISNISFAQTNALNLKFPKDPKISQKFQNAIDEQKNQFNWLDESNKEKIKNYSMEFILDKINNNQEYGYLFDAEYWIAFNYEKIIPQLINRITNKKEVGLVSSADLIIFERIESGDLKSYGHGFIVNDDLFTIAGRANRLLTIITGENFGSVSMKSTPEDLNVLQKKWIDWLKNLQ